MTNNVYVRPATENNRVKVATYEVGTQDQATHYPVYANFIEAVNLGLVSGHEIINVLGTNPAVGTSPEEDIWSAGGTLTYQTTAQTIEAISSDANDTAAGSGARTIVVEGLDSSFTEVSATITMNGVSATTATTQSFIRINKAYVATVGTYGGSNTGNITIRVSSGGDTLGYIEAGEGINGNSHYCIPANKTGYVLTASISVEAAQEADVHILKRENADDTTAPYSPIEHAHHWEAVADSITEEFKTWIVLPEKTDVWGRSAATGGVAASVQIDMDILIIDD